MKSRHTTWLAVAALPAAIIGGLPGGVTASPVHIPTNFADPAFKSVWLRTDVVVDNGSVKRSYYWGPTPGFTAYEDYAEGPNGKHLVQYFDKSRMEINNPSGDKSSAFYVTNGLLTVELITGQMQIGNNLHVYRWPAEINIASDADDTGAGTPTYASFRSVAFNSGPAFQNSARAGEIVMQTINRAGMIGAEQGYANYNVKNAYFEPATHHNIPDVFWNYLNASGPIMQTNGKVGNGRLSNPYFYATGYPIAEPYWASVKIAGVSNTAVLIQPYERRVLTYVPSAPSGFKVQMGNIGLHYYSWRYAEGGKPTPPLWVCNQVPLRGFGTVWAEHPEVRVRLGCTYEPEAPLTVSQQYFQHGQMIDLIGPYGYYGPGNTNKTIFVLFEDGTLQTFPDFHTDDTPEPNITAPAGLYTPVRGFGKVWREGTGAKVRERLGWATAPETVAIAQLPPIPGAVPTAVPVTPIPTPLPGLGGALQRFEHGMMVHAGPVLRKIYVLWADTAYGTYEVNRWTVYDDLFTGP